jgi:hypothetical protein
LRTARYARELLTNRFLTSSLDKAPNGSTGGDAASRSTPPATLLAETTIVEIHVGLQKPIVCFVLKRTVQRHNFWKRFMDGLRNWWGTFIVKLSEFCAGLQNFDT